MARVSVTNRLWFRLALLLAGIHALLLPLLFGGLLLIMQRGLEDALLDEVRTYGRLLADELELGDALNSPARTVSLLDSVILSGRGVYAEVIDGARDIRSGLNAPGLRYPGKDDLRLSERADHTYFLSILVNHAGRQITLRLGFDTSSTVDRITHARHEIELAILLFLAASVALGIWLAKRLTKPLTSLQTAAARIARGDVTSRLIVPSSLHEIRELTDHLEFMRSELVGTNARLEQKIREHAATEGQRRELAERLRLQERIASIGTLASGIAHEFNNILTPVLLYTQSAFDELPPDSTAADDLRHVLTATRRARQLVGRILTFNRDIGDGAHVPLSLTHLTEEVLQLVRVAVPANVEVQSCFERDLPLVHGDPDLTSQMIMNLCTNAYQAMRAAGGRLNVSVTRVPGAHDPRVAAGDYVVLEVSDTGHGISEGQLPRIFEPFFTTREIGEGTGLGLFVVHGIATAMGATITVDSQLSHGTIFRVHFPVYQAQAVLPQQRASTAGASP
jgi:signal transduction histidine kinase